VDATDYERRTASEAATAEERLAGRPTVRRGWRQPSGHPTGSRRPRRPSQIGRRPAIRTRPRWRDAARPRP